MKTKQGTRHGLAPARPIWPAHRAAATTKATGKSSTMVGAGDGFWFVITIGTDGSTKVPRVEGIKGRNVGRK